MRQFNATAHRLPDRDSNVQRRRLLFRGWHNGTQEADLLLGSFAEAFLASFDSNQLDRFEGLLACAEADLLDWITGRSTPPAAYDHDVMGLLRSYQSYRKG
jgi:antitoxin CptB